jgi:hypothetical protein
MADTIKLQKTDKEIEAEKSAKGDTIDLRAKVSVFSADKDPHHKTGTEIKVHPKVAQNLIKNGFVTEKPGEAKDDKFKGDTVGPVQTSANQEDIEI